MAEGDGGEKTEQPTARRLQEARDAGQVARSQDLTAALGLVGGFLLLVVFGQRMLGTLMQMTRALGNPIAPSGNDIKGWIYSTVTATGRMLLPFLLLLMLITVVGALVQSGWVFSWKRLKPDIGNLSPMKGVKRLFSTQAATRLLFGILKMLLVGGAAWLTIVPMVNLVVAAGSAPVRGVLDLAGELMYTLVIRLVLVLFALGVADYIYQRWKLTQQLKMTKQEVRDEMKRMEGDPTMKQRRRQAQFKLAMQRIRMDVPKSDVVVTNPTEYAVALRYERTTMKAPRVTAKGVDLLAAHIRQVAREHGIPVVQRPPLARALYAACDSGQEVPPEHYKAVAEVLAYVYQLDAWQRRKAG